MIVTWIENEHASTITTSPPAENLLTKAEAVTTALKLTGKKSISKQVFEEAIAKIKADLNNIKKAAQNATPKDLGGLEGLASAHILLIYEENKKKIVDQHCKLL